VTIGTALDIFAGPGGWDVAARDLGICTLGIEFDESACQTRRAAGLKTIEGDVRNYGPVVAERNEHQGLIASPPCQTFSAAGNGAGRRALDTVCDSIWKMAKHEELPEFDDERTALVLEPLRYVLLAYYAWAPYRWLAFEQVPAVLPVWEEMARVFRMFGYSVATGKLNAEQYGVPQTRTRAILIASLDREVELPKPTHSKYYARTPAKTDPGVQLWVSMAEALGWGMTHRPYPTVACSSKTGGPDKEKVGGSGARAQIYAELEAGRWKFTTNYLRANATVRDIEEPAPTITAGHDFGERRWLLDKPLGDQSAVRVSEEEAAILQSFPEDHPWQGTKSNKFRQIGNAIPPLLAAAVLKAALGLEQ
jgi:DNA (cytosine-5)-methyltransferase 1